jgi:hypothetical protein
MALELFEIRSTGQLSDRRANIILMRPALKYGLRSGMRCRAGHSHDTREIHP